MSKHSRCPSPQNVIAAAFIDFTGEPDPFVWEPMASVAIDALMKAGFVLLQRRGKHFNILRLNEPSDAKDVVNDV